MHHFQTVRAMTHFAETAQTHADRKLIHLRGIEMEETQEQRLPRIVADRNAQLRAEAKAFFDRLDTAFDLRRVACAQIADRGDARLVFVAQRQMKPEVLQCA